MASFIGSFIGTRMANSECYKASQREVDGPLSSESPHQHEHHVNNSQGAAPSSKELPQQIDTRLGSFWSQIERICPSRNYTSCKSVDRSSWTNAGKTIISDLDFKGLGQWSSFKLTTYNGGGVRKSKGGDHWHIMLRDEEQMVKVPTRVFDEGDGTYTAMVYLLLPGNFKIWAWLWYTDYLGYQVGIRRGRYL